MIHAPMLHICTSVHKCINDENKLKIIFSYKNLTKNTFQKRNKENISSSCYFSTSKHKTDIITKFHS